MLFVLFLVFFLFCFCFFCNNTKVDNVFFSWLLFPLIYKHTKPRHVSVYMDLVWFYLFFL